MLITKEYRRVLYFPGKILLFFLVFTEILFYIGPKDYNISNHFILFAYLLALNIFLFLGYRFGLYIKTLPKKNNKIFFTTETFLIIALLLKIYSLYLMLNSRGVSIFGLFPYLISSVINSGDAYYAEVENLDTSYLLLLLNPIVDAALPLGIYQWQKLKKKYKLILYLIVFFTLSYWLCIGVRKGILDMVIILFMMYISRNNTILINKKKKKNLKILAVVIFALFILYFVISNMSRYRYGAGGEYHLDKSNIRPFYNEYVSDGLNIVLVNVSGYLCQGYYALSKSLELGILPTSPMGISWFTIAIARKFGYDPAPTTYMGVLEQTTDIDMSVNWHTIYVWLANSVTFIGVPFVILLIGMILGCTWKDIISSGRLSAIPLFSLTFLMVFYFFANNQIMSFNFISYFFWLFYYIIKKYS